MDTNNLRPTQGGEPAMDAGDWRSHLQPDSRLRIVNKIMETLKRHTPVSGDQEGLNELRNIAVRFEEKIFVGATSQVCEFCGKFINIQLIDQIQHRMSLTFYTCLWIDFVFKQPFSKCKSCSK